jgi:hypothetical protein
MLICRKDAFNQMKFLAVLRFTWALAIVVNIFFTNSSSFERANAANIFFQWMTWLVVGTFVLYCIITGIQEWSANQFIHASFFNIFGVVFEILVFLAGLYIIDIYRIKEMKLWRLVLVLLWQTGLITLIVADIRRLWRNRNV